jgi:hypothetical protein
MKRNTLTTAVLAGVAGMVGLTNVSNAVNLNPDGLGEVLIYPFYTVNNGLDTLLSVVNTTADVKAVKVRFVESKNSREVLDFNLYLSPFDVWTGVITDPDGDLEGPAAIATSDQSCTVPSLFSQNDGELAPGVPFKNFSTLRLNEFTGVDNSPERTREGHFEMIEMGIVDETIDADDTDLEAAAIHTAGGVPFDCGALVSAWVSGGIWNELNGTGSRVNHTDVRTPEGGLFGQASLISVLGGTQAGYNADAIDAFFDNPIQATFLGPDTLHAQPGREAPSLADADTDGSGFVTSIVFDGGAIVTSTWDDIEAEDAVSAIYMHNQLYNTYETEAALNGATEWVITQPTKRLYVNNGLLPADLPYTRNFTGAQVPDGGACEPIGITYTNREEGDPGVAPGSVNFSPFDPANPIVPVLCYEAQVVTFNQDLTTAVKVHTQSDLLGSPNARNVDTVTVTGGLYENGWALIDFTQNVANVPGTPALGTEDHTLLESGAGTRVYVGLPVTGFSITNVQNGFLTDGDGNSILSNYAGLSHHRGSKRID